MVDSVAVAKDGVMGRNNFSPAEPQEFCPRLIVEGRKRP
jgi:hypothetical protein